MRNYTEPKKYSCTECRDTGRDAWDRLCTRTGCQARQERIDRFAGLKTPTLIKELRLILADLSARVEGLEEDREYRRTLAMERSERS